MKPGGARNKGADAEREVIKLLEPVVRECGQGLLFRNLLQVREGGHDIVGIDWLAIEVKRQEALLIEDWWKQTCRQATNGKIPCLIYRQNRKPWSVVMQGGILGWQGKLHTQLRVTITFADFLQWFRRELTLRNPVVQPVDPFSTKEE